MTARVLRLAKPVKILVLDADGILTDNGLYYDGRQEEGYKRFSIQDGMGVKLAQSAGLEVAVLSGLGNPQARRRAGELGIKEFYGGHLKKLPILKDLLEKKGLTMAQAAYMGDDWLDAALLARVGLPMTVPDAQPEILRLSAWVAKSPGGFGAVREAIRFILLAQGKLGGLWRTWLD